MEETQQAGTFDLHIAFAGMCLLVRDSDRKDKRQMLHVLLPDDDLHMKSHLARLFVNPRYVAGDGTTLDPNGQRIEGMLLDLTGLVPNASAKLNDLRGLVDLDCVDGKAVKRELFTGTNPGGRVKTRISLAAGYVCDGNEGRKFKLGKCTVKNMPTWVQWVIPSIPSSTLTLEFTELNSSGRTFRVALRPVDGRIELAIFHAEERDKPRLPLEPLPLPDEVLLPTGTSSNVNAVHFTAFYPLVSVSANTEPPIYAEASINGAQTQHPEHHDHSGHSGGGQQKGFAGLDYRCIGATAPGEREDPGEP